MKNLPVVPLAVAVLLTAWGPITWADCFAGESDGQAEDVLRSYDGPTQPGVDTSTLTGKVMCGYQGWFNCPGDGAELGWTHWARHRRRPFGPGNVTVDLWPEVSEYDADALYKTEFRQADGRPARVFSSADPQTVLLHFQWMQAYGIDGAFVQRFANGLRAGSPQRRHKDHVLANAREAANRTGRAYAVMYDLSGLAAGEVQQVREDWRLLRQKMKITRDPAYLHHNRRPLVAVWGVGFSDDREYTLSESADLIAALKADGCSVMLGIPSWWREGRRDAVRDPRLREVLRQADVLCPWTVGRYRTPKEAERHAELVWRPDIAWCRDQELDFMPVLYPGFSWHNLHGGELDAIPRLNGAFLWSQFVAAKRAGAQMIYVAMFDEVDEGTAVFKCTNDPPREQGGGFLTYEGLPNDYYLRLVGQGGQLLRGEVPIGAPLPPRR